WFSQHGTGEIKQASSDDVIGMHQMVAHAPADMTAAILSPLFALGYIFFTDWKMGIFVLVWVIVAMMFSSISMLGDFASLNAQYNSALAEVSNATVEMVDGIEVVKTYGEGSGASKRFREAVDNYIDITYIWAKKTGAPFSLSQALMSPPVMLVVLTLFSILCINLAWITLSEAIVVLILGTGVPSAIINVWGTAGFLRTASTSAEHFGSIMDIKPLPEADNPQPIPTENIDIIIDDAHFSYSDKSAFSINGVSIDVAPNTVVALVGKSGSGKTTIARLIPRFWDVNAGSISLSGVDVRNAVSAEVLSRCGVVFQETQLLRMTIAENIALAKPDATKEEIICAAKLAHIHERILELPGKYEAIPGMRGVNLSGGEAQRVAIARALLADPPILILDEATAHADPENEALIQNALAQLVKGRVTIVIAHRLNTIRHAHQIVVMDEGVVAECGTHDELMQQSGIYASMWESQQVKVGVK
ncbi:MAG: ABC transporter ATP-binding protein, partial [Eggerthellaceae bacterium]|nr:ABC transporter ATP-binding protein [Eggerthellaceae bacterium]